MILKQRQLVPELMDDPELDFGLHQQALTGLRRVNRITRSSDILWPSIRKLASESPTGKLRVLDVACGGGDGVVSLSNKVQQRGLDVQIDGCDISTQAIEYAEEYAAANSPLQNRFVRLDVLQDPLPTDYDVVMCSLFLHHLTETEAVSLLSRMATACRRRILISDLVRSLLGYVLAWTGCHLLTRSPIVHVDGPRSVRAAWSIDEVADLARQAGVDNPVFTRHWPQRFLLSWSKS